MLPCEANKCILSTSDTVLLSSSADATPATSPCTHGEADTRLILHASDCARQGIDNIILRTVDTDVVVLAISNFSRLKISRCGLHLELVSSIDTFQYMTSSGLLGKRNLKCCTFSTHSRAAIRHQDS